MPERRPGFDAAAVHTMGKVGSLSLAVAVRRLERRLNQWPSFHTHLLNPAHTPSLQRGVAPIIAPSRDAPAGHILAARQLRWRFLDQDRPVAVITAIREPISRNVSAFFAQLDNHLVRQGKGVDPDDPEQLYDLFRREHYHDAPQHWLERELNEVFSVDVFAEPFPDRGVLELTADPHRILIVRTSLSDQRKAAAMRDFLDSGGLRVGRANVTNQKLKSRGRPRPVQEFRQLLGRDEAYLDEMLALPMARHFFTEQQRDAIHERWLRWGRRAEVTRQAA